MMWLVESALIGAVFLVFVVLVCVWQDRAPAERLSDPEPMPGEWPLPFASEYGPWPTADTGALPILSRAPAAVDRLARDAAAGQAQLEREIAAMIRQAERELPWR